MLALFYRYQHEIHLREIAEKEGVQYEVDGVKFKREAFASKTLAAGSVLDLRPSGSFAHNRPNDHRMGHRLVAG